MENRITYELASQWGKLIHFAFVQITFFHSFCMYFLKLSLTIHYRGRTNVYFGIFVIK